MNLFRVNFTVEVDQVANALAIQTPVPVQLVCQQQQWQGYCETPYVLTQTFDRMDEALFACANEVAAEYQAIVNDRPVVAGRITLDDIPAGMFQ